MEVDGASEKQFEERKKALFTCLESAEKSITKGSTLNQEDVDFNREDILFLKPRVVRDRKGAKQDALRFRGKESIFKREEQPIQKCLKSRSVPEFKINPQKWTKYSLAEADTSDRANTAAAFNFLREIEERKNSAIEDAIRSEGNSSLELKFNRPKITYNKSAGLREKIVDETEEEKIVKGSLVVMPEYVVGKKVRRERKTVAVSATDSGTSDKKSRELRLDHLLDEEENDEE